LAVLKPVVFAFARLFAMVSSCSLWESIPDTADRTICEMGIEGSFLGRPFVAV
jgi:hypothetical protein